MCTAHVCLATHPSACPISTFCKRGSKGSQLITAQGAPPSFQQATELQNAVCVITCLYVYRL